MNVYRAEDVFADDRGISVRTMNVACDEPPHTHEFIELVYIREGTGVHGIDGVEYRLARGDLLFINYRQVHDFRVGEGMRICNILLRPEFIGERLVNLDNAFGLLSLSAFSEFGRGLDRGKPLVRFSGGERRETEALIDRMEREATLWRDGSETVLRAGMMILLADVFRKLSDKEPQKDGKPPLDSAVFEYIREHCSERLSLEALARRCFYNPSYFSRLFREQCGMTLTGYIRQTRMERARDLLSDSRIPVEEVARLTGFGSAPLFYRRFREETGVTPAEWRRGERGKK